jgi:hypothetical protein
LLTSEVAVDNMRAVSVKVHNVRRLIGMDIPLRFGSRGDDLQLRRVVWSSRVADWEFKHAAVDSVNKTVILGLISELTTVRESAELDIPGEDGETTVATLYFTVGAGVKFNIATCATVRPEHRLHFYYNIEKRGQPHLVELVPDVECATAK